MKWTAAARIYIAALEGGSYKGKQAAREGILEMAKHLDNANARAEAANAETEARAGM